MLVQYLWIIYNHESFLVFTVFQYPYELHDVLPGDASFAGVSLFKVIVIYKTANE